MQTPAEFSTYLPAILRICGLTMAAMLAMPSVAESSTEPRRTNVDASIAIPATLVAGSEQVFRESGQLTVTSLDAAGETTTVNLRGIASGAEASLRLSKKAIEESSIAVGAILNATVSATGTLLFGPGKMLMFVPNEVGRSLQHQSRTRVQ